MVPIQIFLRLLRTWRDPSYAQASDKVLNDILPSVVKSSSMNDIHHDHANIILIKILLSRIFEWFFKDTDLILCDIQIIDRFSWTSIWFQRALINYCVSFFFLIICLRPSSLFRKLWFCNFLYHLRSKFNVILLSVWRYFYIQGIFRFFILMVKL